MNKNNRRNPGRIDIVLKKIGDVWKQVPDIRFGQLISNVYNQCGQDAGAVDMFYQEDDAFMRDLENYVKVCGIDTLDTVETEPITSELNLDDINFLFDASKDVCKKLQKHNPEEDVQVTLTTNDALTVLHCLYDCYHATDTCVKSDIRNAFRTIMGRMS